MKTEREPPVAVRGVALGSADYQCTVELRRVVLLEPFGIPLSTAQADDAEAQHLGAFSGEDCVGCLLLIERERGSWQLRQMAVRPDLQGRGVGRLLVEEALTRAREAGVHQLWAHAREPAVPFYERLGFAAVGAPFEQVGLPHRTVTRAP